MLGYSEFEPARVARDPGFRLTVPGSEPGLTDYCGIAWSIRCGCLRKVRQTEPVLNIASSLEHVWVTVQEHNKQQNLYRKEGMGPARGFCHRQC